LVVRSKAFCSAAAVMLQLIDLDGAADGIFSHPDIYAAIEKAGLAPAAEKLTRLIRLALAPETADLDPRAPFNPRTGLPLDTVDSHSDPAAAMRAAWQLIAWPKVPAFAAPWLLVWPA
jgi:hypothetical protein